MLLGRDRLSFRELAGEGVYIAVDPGLRDPGLRGRAIGVPRGRLELSFSRGIHVQGATSPASRSQWQFRSLTNRIYRYGDSATAISWRDHPRTRSAVRGDML